MIDEPEKPKITISQSTGSEKWWFPISDLLVIMKNRSKRLWYYLGEEVGGMYRPPFEIPTYLLRAEENGEEITPKQRRKLLKRYGHEWNVYLKKHTKPAEAPEHISYYSRN